MKSEERGKVNGKQQEEFRVEGLENGERGTMKNEELKDAARGFGGLK